MNQSTNNGRNYNRSNYRGRGSVSQKHVNSSPKNKNSNNKNTNSYAPKGRYFHGSLANLDNPNDNFDHYNAPNCKRKRLDNNQDIIKIKPTRWRVYKRRRGNQNRGGRFQDAAKFDRSNVGVPDDSGNAKSVFNTSNAEDFEQQSSSSTPAMGLRSSVIFRRRLKGNAFRPLFENNASQLFKWLIHPVAPFEFNKTYWEKSPLFVDRNRLDYYSDLNLTTRTIDTLLRDNHVLFTKNIDITTYTDGVRETHNPVGRAHAHIVWDFFKNGCSIRLLNPQTFINSIYKLNEKLQKYFNGFVGSNVYLTPPNSQGFAPHYDDIEAIVLQLQGCKYWKIYQPRTKREELPRYSSHNFTEEEVGQPILEVALRPGDLLYFPRGFIHQASTRDELSLHITLSAYQCTAYVDLFEKLLPNALRRAAEEEVELREGLPLDYPWQFGLASYKMQKNERKQLYKEKIESLLKKVLDHVDIDSAVDRLVAKNLHDQLPPRFRNVDYNSMVFNNSTRLSKNNKIAEVVQLQLSTPIKLVDPGVCRLVKTDDGKYLLYHSINNSMEYHGNDEEFLEVPEEGVPAYQKLCISYPSYVRVELLPFSDDEAKWSFANSLWEIGLLQTRHPLKSIKCDLLNNEAVAENNEEDDEGSEDDDNDEIADEEEAIENDCNENNSSYITVDSYSIEDEAGSDLVKQPVDGKDEDSHVNVCVDLSGDDKSDSNRDDVVIVE